jgi:hypothetical protein
MKPLTRKAFIERNRKYGTTCSLKTFMSKMSPKDQQELRDAIADVENVQVSAIQTVMEERGWNRTRHVFERHRKNGCDQCGITRVSGR